MKLIIPLFIAAARQLDRGASRTIRRKFQRQFHPLIIAGSKRQTVRPRSKRPPRPGDLFVAEAWIGRPYASKVEEIACGIVTECFLVTAAYAKGIGEAECIRWEPL